MSVSQFTVLHMAAQHRLTVPAIMTSSCTNCCHRRTPPEAMMTEPAAVARSNRNSLSVSEGRPDESEIWQAK